MARKKVTTKKQRSIITRSRNLIIYSVSLIIIGFCTAKYQTEILHIISDKGYSYFGTNSNTSKSSSHKAENELAQSNGEVVKHTYYSLSYNEDREQANWVSYVLTEDMVSNKKVKRTDDFRPDSSVSTGSAELSDYRGSGYDRGHLCPAADMDFDKNAMSETFFMSNMSPQVPALNRGAWKKLEAQARYWAKKHGEIYIVTGPIYLPDKRQKEIGKNGVDIPDAYYKVILDYHEPDVKAIGFFMPNKRLNQPLSVYSVPVNKIEAVTGIDFFSFIPDEQEELLESQADYKAW